MKILVHTHTSAPFSLFLTLLSIPFTSTAFGEAKHAFELGLRPRYAEATEENQDGRSASLLIRSSLNSRWNRKFSTQLEYDYVETWFENEHSDGVRFNGEPLIADVPGGEINQALLHWSGRQLDIFAGRQRIDLANQRFMGSAAYWQNDQTFDAFRAKYQFLSMSSVQYIYLANANTYLGDDAGYWLTPDDTLYGVRDGVRPPGLRGDQRHNSHLLHLEFKEWDYSQVLLWYYRFENETAPERSNNTLGAGYRFSCKADTLKYIVEADLAQQELTDFRDNSIPYYRLEAGVGIQSLQVLLSQEYLGSDQDWGFITPLGSVNDFQGWAHVFLYTPDEGIVDTRVQFDWRFNPFRVDARYHLFEAAQGGAAYGKEFDLDLIWKLARKHKLSLRFADFKSDYPNLEDRQTLSLTWTYNL